MEKGNNMLKVIDKYKKEMENERDRDVIIADKGEFSMTNQEKTEFAKTNIENHIL
jgi:hypothetical protein